MGNQINSELKAVGTTNKTFMIPFSFISVLET